MHVEDLTGEERNLLLFIAAKYPPPTKGSFHYTTWTQIRADAETAQIRLDEKGLERAFATLRVGGLAILIRGENDFAKLTLTADGLIEARKHTSNLQNLMLNSGTPEEDVETKSGMSKSHVIRGDILGVLYAHYGRGLTLRQMQSHVSGLGREELGRELRHLIEQGFVRAAGGYGEVVHESGVEQKDPSFDITSKGREILEGKGEKPVTTKKLANGILALPIALLPSGIALLLGAFGTVSGAIALFGEAGKFPTFFAFLAGGILCLAACGGLALLARIRRTRPGIESHELRR